jgi:hypothetical protein
MTNLRIMFVILSVSSFTHAYELETHSLVTLTGFNRSVLGNGSSSSTELYKNLGIDRLGVTSEPNRLAPFSIFVEASGVLVDGRNVSNYFDLGAADQSPPVDLDNIFARSPRTFESARMPPSYATQTGLVLNYPYSDRAALVEGWLMRGAIREDDMPKSIQEKIGVSDPPDDDPHFNFQLLNANATVRVFNHFYNPLLLENNQLPSLPFLPGQNLNALTWAIGVDDPLAPSFNPALSRNNHFTWQDAREYYYRAVTWKTRPNTLATTLAGTQFDYVARMRYFSSTFNSLGHVVHLLQDMAQPQHSRNDPHNPHIGVGDYKCCGTDINRRLYEAYTEARIALPNANAGDVNQYLRAMYEDGAPVTNVFPPIQLGNYPIPSFSTPVKFFTTRPNRGGVGDNNVLTRRGIADYSNRGFFTDGTRPGMVAGLANPPPLTDAGWTFVQRDQVQPSSGIVVRRGDYFRGVPDSVSPGYVDIGENGARQVFHGSGSIWQDVAGVQAQQIDADLLGMTQQADMLLPRAVAYSAGVINYFFRGTIDVQPPTVGLMAIIDHGVLHTVDGAGFPRRTADNQIYGFEELKLKIRNTTPAITESGSGAIVPQAMADTGVAPNSARLVAVARYHRNPCYRPNLSGERTINSTTSLITEPVGCAVGTRTPIPETSVSAPYELSAAELNGAALVEVKFNFASDPIPINSTDLFVQVVYYGPLGDEPTAVAIGSIDVMEPTYYTLWNNTDYALTNNVWTLPSTLTAITQSRICHDSRFVFIRGAPPAAPNTQTNATRLNRIALLTDQSTHTMRARVILGAVAPTVEVTTVATVLGKVRQAQKEFVSATVPYVATPLNESRGLVWGSAGAYFYRYTPPAVVPNPPDPGSLLPLWGEGSPTAGMYEEPKEGFVGNPMTGFPDPNGICPPPVRGVEALGLPDQAIGIALPQ